MEVLVVFMGVFLGCLARSMIPFMRKLGEAARESKPFAWDRRYTVSLVAATFVGFLAAMLVTPIAMAEVAGGTLVLFNAFMVGFSSNAIINELMKRLGVV